MPNWVYSAFTVTGPAAEVDRFRRRMIVKVPVEAGAREARGTSPATITILDFDAILPMPADVEESASQAWSVANWGTKWNAQDFRLREERYGHLLFDFATPWDFPTAVFEALAGEFPTLVFDGSAFEEQHEFELAGQFNGDRSWGPAELDWGDEG